MGVPVAPASDIRKESNRGDKGKRVNQEVGLSGGDWESQEDLDLSIT